MTAPLDHDEARSLDDADPMSAWRDEFEMPVAPDGSPQAYFAGNSLGVLSTRSRRAVERILEAWSTDAVAGHFTGDESWYRYDEAVAALHAPVVGAPAHELGVMGGLTSNLHVLMASFYRPEASRRRILIEPHAFPSDRYAVEAQVHWHGGDPMADVITIDAANPDDVTVDDLERALAEHGDSVALALFGGVNYYTGQLLDIADWIEQLRAHDIAVGLDLAHAVGNVPLALHDWAPDFAAWCTYKYLNGGPGAVAGYYVNERHHDRDDLVRLAGWWGNDPETRFDMHGQEHFVPRRSADGWKASNPSALSMAPVKASLEIFNEATMPALRERSLRLTAFLERGVDAIETAEIVTPRDPERRGCQLSVRVPGDAGALEKELIGLGVVPDARDPDILRFAPVPLYTRFADIAVAMERLSALLD